MATIENLNISITQMSNEELLEHIKNARASRKISKNKIKKRVSAKDKQAKILSSISKTEAETLLKILGRA